MNDITIDVSAFENPDRKSIESKEIIDISLSIQDISSSLSIASASIKLNHPNTQIILIDDKNSGTVGDLYYTPTYTEKINYDQWKRKVSKTFIEFETTHNG